MIEQMRYGKWIAVSERVPEAGQIVIAFYANEYKRPRQIRAFHVPQFTIEAHDEDDYTEHCEDNDRPYLHEGWYECNEYEDRHWFVSGDITHWMPLPEPPEI